MIIITLKKIKKKNTKLSWFRVTSVKGKIYKDEIQNAIGKEKERMSFRNRLIESKLNQAINWVSLKINHSHWSIWLNIPRV
jgi:alkylated DNA nucleotide flippase Atl1